MEARLELFEVVWEAKGGVVTTIFGQRLQVRPGDSLLCYETSDGELAFIDFLDMDRVH